MTLKKASDLDAFLISTCVYVLISFASGVTFKIHLK